MGCAPDLNPVEYLWLHWKQHRVTHHASPSVAPDAPTGPTLVMAFWAAG